MPIPDVFAAAYFAACAVVAGALAVSLFVVLAYLWRGGK